MIHGNEQVDAALGQMIASVGVGVVSNFLPFDAQGVPMRLE